MPLDRDLADHFAALDGFDRAFKLSFEGPPLRRGANRAARKRRKRREAELRQQMEAEMQQRSRRACRGPVSVAIGLFGRDTSGPMSVKAYLDCMAGVFYADDRAVEHLFVRCFSDQPSADEEKVYIDIEPLSVYVGNFEHAYRRLGPAFGEEQGFDFDAEHERDELWELVEDEGVREKQTGTGLLDSLDPELARMRREYRRERIADLRLRQILSGHLGPHDRPGPPSHFGAASSVDGEDVSAFDLSRRELPGRFQLPLPGGHNWTGEVERALVSHMERWGVGDLPINYSIGLDLAVQGLPPRGKDLDNLAHAVIGSFRRLLGSEDAEPFTSYRVYRRPGKREAVRAQLVDARLLAAVQGEVFESHLRRLQLPRD